MVEPECKYKSNSKAHEPSPTPLLSPGKAQKKHQEREKMGGDEQKTNFLYHQSHLCRGLFTDKFYPELHQTILWQGHLAFGQHFLRKSYSKGEEG